MINKNMSNVDAAGSFTRPVPGGYVMKIVKVNNNEPKEMLELSLDFTEGDLKDYYAQLNDKFKFWGARTSKSYKEKALPFFRAFIEAVQKSNEDTDGLVIGDYEAVDETKLVDKLVGVVVGEREYTGNDGLQKTGLDWYNAQFMAAEEIAEGNYTIPEIRKQTNAQPGTAEVVVATADFGPVNDDDIPF